MKYYGNVFRPPSEARSLIVQATIGCAHNRCRFCDMYKGEPFVIRKMDDILADIDTGMSYYNWTKVFLADGDALVMRTEQLVTILTYIYEKYPFVERVTAYGTIQDVIRKTPEELKKIRKHGLTMLYVGIESGSDVILETMNKGVTAQETIDALIKAKEAGFQTSVTAISGLGGIERSREHALDTAAVVSASKPDYVSLLSLMISPDTELYEDIQEGSFSLLNPEQVLYEMKVFLENVDSEGSIFRSNHASNYVPLRGTFNADIPLMVAQIDHALQEKNFKPEFLRGF